MGCYLLCFTYELGYTLGPRPIFLVGRPISKLKSKTHWYCGFATKPSQKNQFKNYMKKFPSFFFCDFCQVYYISKTKRKKKYDVNYFLSRLQSIKSPNFELKRKKSHFRVGDFNET